MLIILVLIAIFVLYLALEPKEKIKYSYSLPDKTGYSIESRDKIYKGYIKQDNINHFIIAITHIKGNKLDQELELFYKRRDLLYLFVVKNNKNDNDTKSKGRYFPSNPGPAR
jgi:hypothetical protein